MLMGQCHRTDESKDHQAKQQQHRTLKPQHPIHGQEGNLRFESIAVNLSMQNCVELSY